jgi:hypothetical protein
MKARDILAEWTRKSEVTSVSACSDGYCKGIELPTLRNTSRITMLSRSAQPRLCSPRKRGSFGTRDDKSLKEIHQIKCGGQEWRGKSKADSSAEVHRLRNDNDFGIGSLASRRFAKTRIEWGTLFLAVLKLIPQQKAGPSICAHRAGAARPALGMTSL